MTAPDTVPATLADRTRRSGIAPWLIVVAVLIVCALHAQTFFMDHREGDEVAYLALAEEMTWTVQHYSTADHYAITPELYPYAMYRDPVFAHPPLLPLVLKAGFVLGHPERVGLAFLLAVHLATLWLVVWLTRATPLLRPHGGVALVLMAVCPYLAFSTTRLHTDGLLAALALIATVTTYRAVRRPGVLVCAVMVVSVIAAMSARYTGIIVLPCVVAAAVVGLVQARRSRTPLATTATTVALILLAAAIGVGLIHFIRVWVQWGSWRAPYDADTQAMNQMLTRINARPRHLAWIYQLWIAPVLAIVVLPVYWRGLWHLARRFRFEALLLVLGPAWWLFTACFTPVQLRYYAPALPLFYLSIAILATYADRTQGLILRWLGILTLVSGGLTAFCMTWYRPAYDELVPWPFVLIPNFAGYFN